MKRKKILKRIDKAIRKKDREGVYFQHDSVYYNLFPLCRSEDFIAASYDIDFQQNGYLIFPVSGISSFRGKWELERRIIRGEHTADIAQPDVPLKSWKSMFRFFKKEHAAIMIDTPSEFYYGYVTKVGKHSIRIRQFYEDGTLEPPEKLRFKEICLIYYKNRYAELSAKYARKDS